MKYRKLLDNIQYIEELSHSDIIHNSIGFVINNAIDKDKRDLYDATKGRWKCSLEKAKNVDLVFSLYKGVIVEIWKPNFWKKSDIEGRIQWEGIKCEDEKIREMYLYKKAPKAYSAIRYYGDIKNR